MLGSRCGEILQSMDTADDTVVRAHTLRQILKNTGLYRKPNESDSLDAAAFLSDQLEGPGRFHRDQLHHLNCTQGEYAVTPQFHIIMRHDASY